MSEEIKISQAAVDKNEQALSGAATYFQEAALVPADSKTTLTANGAGQDSFGTSERLLATMGEIIEKDAGNIRQLGASFQEYDEMMSKLWENGCRYETITGPK